MSIFHYLLVLFALGVALVPLLFGLFALQLGAVMFIHEIVVYFARSWLVFCIGGAFALGAALLVIVRGVYEVVSFIIQTWDSRLSVFSKVTMSLAFVIDLLLSDLLIALGFAVLSYTYVIIGINQRFVSLWLVLVSFALLWTGVFFQVAFVSAYANAKNFSDVVDSAKKFIAASPVEVSFK